MPDRPEHLLRCIRQRAAVCRANYGIGANMDGGKSLAAMTGLPVTRDNHVTLKHLCRIGAKGRGEIAMTAFLARCHRELKASGIRGAIGLRHCPLGEQ